MKSLEEIRGHTFLKDLGRSPLVLDLGANDGKFARAILAAYPEARLVLVEGDPLLTDSLKRTFGRDGRVRLYQGLVGSETRARMPFHLCRVPEGNSVHRAFSESWAAGQSRTIEVEMISFTDLLALIGPEHIALVKVDIEGSEWDVLPTVGEAAAQVIDQFSVEFHDFLDPSLRPQTERCIQHLQELGYRTRARPAAHVHGSPYFDCLFYR